MLFSVVAEYFNKIESAGSRLKMTDLIAELLSKANAIEAKQLVYLMQGRIAPQFIKLEIGLGEKLLINAISLATGFKEKEIENVFKEKGDLGLALMYFIEKKKQAALFKEDLTLSKVFENFSRIARAEGSGSQELKLKLMAELINSAKPLEGKYIIRIPLENLRLGIGDPTIMDALAILFLNEFKKLNPRIVKEIENEFKKEEDIQRQLKFKVRALIESKYNIYSDLGGLTFILKDKGLKGLNDLNITLGVPIRPTLAERLSSAEEIIEKLGKCLVEAKYDGFRLAVHKDKNNITIFSRNQEDMTEMFPEIVNATKNFVNATQAIFEGEALAFNEETQEFYPFQVTIQRKRKYEVKEFAERFPLKLFVFDLLYFDGINLMPKPLIERRKKLIELIKENDVIELTDAIITDNAKEMNDFFNEKVSQGLEGIIAKDLNAEYIAGARKFAWIKLKRSYKHELSDTLDLVLIGYFKGKGKRQKFGLGSLLCAVYNEENDSFESVAKLASGLTEKELSELEKMLSSIITKKKNPRILSQIEPDFWLEPKFVIEVRADEITKSPVHLAGKTMLKEGLALRFPRFVKLREKKPEDATTTKELIELFEKQKRVSIEEQKSDFK